MLHFGFKFSRNGNVINNFKISFQFSCGSYIKYNFTITCLEKLEVFSEVELYRTKIVQRSYKDYTKIVRRSYKYLGLVFLSQPSLVLFASVIPSSPSFLPRWFHNGTGSSMASIGGSKPRSRSAASLLSFETNALGRDDAFFDAPAVVVMVPGGGGKCSLRRRRRKNAPGFHRDGSFLGSIRAGGMWRAWCLCVCCVREKDVEELFSRSEKWVDCGLCLCNHQ